MPGQESFGKYILLEKLATGGMAEVYLAKNPGIGISKFVAIKRILPQFSENENFIEMFKGEAKIAINLAHSNIVSIHEFGFEKDQFYIVMDFVEGRNLRQILNKLKKNEVSLSIEQTVFIIKEIAAGLDHAHRCLDGSTGKPLNIIHRDISPQNVMISFEGEVKIVDFGIAKAETQIETTRAGELKGKFGYMSPEQAEGQAVDLRTDIFSLGIVLWEMLAGDRLFIANNEINTLRKIRECQVPSLRKINPNIPQELERIAGMALAKDRNLRYQTSASLHRELNRFMNRQYPDFSPHDFSVFIKTLFAGDILESRKRQIEYSAIGGAAHVNGASGQAAQNASRTHAEPSAARVATSTTGPGTTLTRTEQDEPSVSGAAPIDFANDGRAKASKEAREIAENRSREQVKAAEQLRARNVESLKPPPTAPLTAPKAVPLRIATQKELTRTSARPSEFSIAEPSRAHRKSPREGTYSTGLSIKRKRSPSLANLTLFALALAMIGGSGWYMADPVGFKTKLRPAAAIFQSATGIKFASSEGSDLAAGETSISSTSNPTVKVTSVPSGAEIWVDDKRWPDSTPAEFELPEGPHVIRLHAEGFADSVDRLMLRSPGLPLHRVLVQEKFASLSVDVDAPSDIYVGDEKVASGATSIRDRKVLAEQDLVVRVVNLANPSETISRTVHIPEKRGESLKLSFAKLAPAASARKKP